MHLSQLREHHHGALPARRPIRAHVRAGDHLSASVMRVLAASFRDQASANDTRTRILEELALDPDELGIDSLPSNASGPITILAGRFDDSSVAVARRLVEQGGGQLLMDEGAESSP